MASAQLTWPSSQHMKGLKAGSINAFGSALAQDSFRKRSARVESAPDHAFFKHSQVSVALGVHPQPVTTVLPQAAVTTGLPPVLRAQQAGGSPGATHATAELVPVNTAQKAAAEQRAEAEQVLAAQAAAAQAEAAAAMEAEAAQQARREQEEAAALAAEKAAQERAEAEVVRAAERMRQMKLDAEYVRYLYCHGQGTWFVLP